MPTYLFSFIRGCAFTQSVVALFPRAAMDLKFLPPYSPQLNPVELWFARLKARVRNLRPRPSTRHQLKNQVYALIHELSSSSPKPLFREMRRWITRALARQPFE